MPKLFVLLSASLKAEAANSFPLFRLNFKELDKSLFAIKEKLSPFFASPFNVTARPFTLKLLPEYKLLLLSFHFEPSKFKSILLS